MGATYPNFKPSLSAGARRLSLMNLISKNKAIWEDVFLVSRVMTTVRVSKKGCWVWQQARNRLGYGILNIKKGEQSAHRVSYLLFKGPLPRRLTVDHLCRNHSCVNPSHLEAVSLAENIRRGRSPPAMNARKTHCLKGHPFDLYYTRRKKGFRTCSQCISLRLKHLRKIARKRGLCTTCHRRSVQKGRRLCVTCCNRTRADIMSRSVNRRRLGMCTACHAKAVPGISICRRHLHLRRLHTKKIAPLRRLQRIRKIKGGFCCICLKRKPQKGKTNCRKCINIRRLAYITARIRGRCTHCSARVWGNRSRCKRHAIQQRVLAQRKETILRRRKNTKERMWRESHR